MIRVHTRMYIPRTMPRRYIAAGCNTKDSEGFSLHTFPCNKELREKWIRAVKRQRSNWDGPSKYSLQCSKHFEPNSFVKEGSRYRDEAGMPVKKQLKPDAVPTIFLLSIHGGGTSRSKNPPLRLAAQKQQRQAVSKNKLAIYLLIIHPL